MGIRYSSTDKLCSDRFCKRQKALLTALTGHVNTAAGNVLPSAGRQTRTCSAQTVMLEIAVCRLLHLSKKHRQISA